MSKTKGPTDKAIRDFKDSYDETKRYKNPNKRNRRRVREELSKIKNVNWKDLDEEEYA